MAPKEDLNLPEGEQKDESEAEQPMEPELVATTELDISVAAASEKVNELNTEENSNLEEQPISATKDIAAEISALLDATEEKEEAFEEEESLSSLSLRKRIGKGVSEEEKAGRRDSCFLTEVVDNEEVDDEVFNPQDVVSTIGMSIVDRYLGLSSTVGDSEEEEESIEKEKDCDIKNESLTVPYDVEVIGMVTEVTDIEKNNNSLKNEINEDIELDEVIIEDTKNTAIICENAAEIEDIQESFVESAPILGNDSEPQVALINTLKETPEEIDTIQEIEATIQIEDINFKSSETIEIVGEIEAIAGSEVEVKLVSGSKVEENLSSEVQTIEIQTITIETEDSMEKIPMSEAEDELETVPESVSPDTTETTARDGEDDNVDKVEETALFNVEKTAEVEEICIISQIEETDITTCNENERFKVEEEIVEAINSSEESIEQFTTAVEGNQEELETESQIESQPQEVNNFIEDIKKEFNEALDKSDKIRDCEVEVFGDIAELTDKIPAIVTQEQISVSEVHCEEKNVEDVRRTKDYVLLPLGEIAVATLIIFLALILFYN